MTLRSPAAAPPTVMLSEQPRRTPWPVLASASVPLTLRPIEIAGDGDGGGGDVDAAAGVAGDNIAGGRAGRRGCAADRYGVRAVEHDAVARVAEIDRAGDVRADIVAGDRVVVVDVENAFIEGDAVAGVAGDDVAQVGGRAADGRVAAADEDAVAAIRRAPPRRLRADR